MDKSDLLRALVMGFAIVGPLWVVGPLLRRGKRFWPAVAAVAVAYAALGYYYFRIEFDETGAGIRAVAMAALVVLFGRFMAQAQLKQIEQDKKDAAVYESFGRNKKGNQV